jgi:DnaJ like chaperone protein
MLISIDRKYYKFVAIIPGYLLGGIIGACAAFLLVRELMKINNSTIEYELVLLKLSSLLVKADGRVDENEVKYVRDFFVITFGNRKAEGLFKKLKKTDISYSVIQFLYGVASSDGNVSQSEDDFIFTVGSSLNYSQERINQIRNQFVNTSKKKYSKITECLQVLGLDETATAAEIKRTYRTLVKEYHPDKLIGMSEGIINLAKQKFQEIQAANEYLNKNYV